SSALRAARRRIRSQGRSSTTTISRPVFHTYKYRVWSALQSQEKSRTWAAWRKSIASRSIHRAREQHDEHDQKNSDENHPQQAPTHHPAAHHAAHHSSHLPAHHAAPAHPDYPEERDEHDHREDYENPHSE